MAGMGVAAGRQRKDVCIQSLEPAGRAQCRAQATAPTPARADTRVRLAPSAWPAREKNMLAWGLLSRVWSAAPELRPIPGENMFNKPNLFHGAGDASAARNVQRAAGTNVAAASPALR